MDHPIFANFSFDEEHSDDLYHYSISGVRTLKEYERHIVGDIVAGGRVDVVSDVKGLPYRCSDDYYEWIDLLSAIDAADENFVLLELGAGFGRWISNAAYALRRHKRKQPQGRFLGVEADHRHFDWMKNHFALNDIGGDAVVMLNKAVASERKFELFPMADVYETFGASLMDTAAGAGLAEMYAAGNHFAQTGGKIYQIVEVITLEDCIKAALPGGGLIDIIHMDIQGAEQDVIATSTALLNATVKRMHIGTHSHVIENNLYSTLIANQWRVERMFRYQSEAFGEYGKFTTWDGMISAVNTRFEGEPGQA